MGRVWSCGFELQSTTVEWDGAGGTPTIESDTVRTGHAALRCAPTAGLAYIQQRVVATETAPWWVRVYVWVDTLPDQDTCLIETLDDANQVVAEIKFTTTGTLQLWDRNETLGAGGAQQGADSTALSTGTWYRVELGIRELGYGAEALLDGTSFASTSGLVTGENVNRFRWGICKPCTADVVLDDIAVNDGADAPTVLRSNSMDGTDETAVTVANSANHGDAYSTVDSSGVTYDTDVAYYGSAGIRLDDGASSNGMAWESLSLDDCAIRLYVHRPAATTDGNVWWNDVNGSLVIGAGGDLAWDGLSLTGALPDDTWCRIEATRNGDQATLSVWSADPESTGTPDATTSGTVTAGTITQWWLEHQASTGALWVDSWALDDAATEIGPVTAPHWPGQGGIVHLVPSAGGDNNGFDLHVGGGGGAAGNYTRVDDLTPDDADSYNATDSSGSHVDDVRVTSRTDAGIRSDSTITVVQVGARVGSDGTGSTRDVELRLKSAASGTVSTSATLDLAIDGWATHGIGDVHLHPLTAATSPETGTAWTVSELDDVQVGYATVTSSTLERRVSAVWVAVDFVQGSTPIGGPDLVGLPGAEAGVSLMPTLIAEAGFTATATTGATLHLDDAQRGLLDTATLGGGTPWEDISSWVRSASTSRGSDRITSPVIAYDAGTGRLVLDNRDRRFDPTHLAGPYVAGGRSQVTPMRRIRLRARWGSTTNLLVNPSFEGNSTAGWAGGTDTSIDATTAVVSRWGGYALQLTRSGSGVADHEVTASGVEGVTGGAVGEGDQVAVSVYVYIPNQVYSAVTAITVAGADSAGNAVFTAQTLSPPSAADTWERVRAGVTLTDSLHEVTIGVATDGSLGTGVVVAYLDAAQVVEGASPEPFDAPETTYGLLRGHADEWDVAWVEPNESSSTVPFTDAFKPFANRELAAADFAPVGAGETTGARIERILDAISWPAADRDIATGDSTLQGTDLAGGVLAQLRSVAEAELGELHIDAEGHVTFRNRTAMWEDDRSTRVQATFGDAGDELPYADLRIAYDDATLANHVTVTVEGGADQVATDEASRDEFLTHTYSASGLLLETDAEAADYAELLLYMSAQPELRFESITVRPRSDRRLWPQALGRQLGDRIRIRRRPPGGGDVIEREVIIRGVSHDITPDDWETTFALQSASKSAFFVLDDARLGRLNHNALGY